MSWLSLVCYEEGLWKSIVVIIHKKDHLLNKHFQGISRKIKWKAVVEQCQLSLCLPIWAGSDSSVSSISWENLENIFHLDQRPSVNMLLWFLVLKKNILQGRTLQWKILQGAFRLFESSAKEIQFVLCGMWVVSLRP